MWRNTKKGRAENESEAIGVLAFEVANLMSKIVNLWQFLREKEIQRVRREILSSAGLQKLVSSDGGFLMDLALDEIVDTVGIVSRSVVRFGRNCTDPHFRQFKFFVSNPILYEHEWSGWEYKLNKMERRVKKMESFVVATMKLFRELDVLAEQEQILRRMRANRATGKAELVEFQRKVECQFDEVRHLKEISPWIRTYDYTVRILARSLLTILERIKLVFGNDCPPLDRDHDEEFSSSDIRSRHRTFRNQPQLQASVYPSERIFCGLSSGPLGRSSPKSVEIAENSKHPQFKTKQLAQLGDLRQCIVSETDSPLRLGTVGGSKRFDKDYVDTDDASTMESLNFGYLICGNRVYFKLAKFSASKHGLLNAPSTTLGDAALALHYANVILVIQKLASSPHTIDSEDRADLYNMLTSTIQSSLQARLSKSRNSSAYNASVATKWSLEIRRILKWLAPLAHNMIKWHNKRNFETEQEVTESNVLLVQTLHYANQAKTELAIVKLFVGLSYICKTKRRHVEEVFPEFNTRRAADRYTPKMSIQKHDRYET